MLFHDAGENKADDGDAGQIWDPRQKESVDYLETNFPVTAVAISEAGNEIFSGSIDNDIKVSPHLPRCRANGDGSG